jgi:hypothetical protein
MMECWNDGVLRTKQRIPLFHYSIIPTVHCYHSTVPTLRVCAFREPHFIIGENFPVADPQCLDPALLTERQCNEEPQLDQLRNGKVAVQLFP